MMQLEKSDHSIQRFSHFSLFGVFMVAGLAGWLHYHHIWTIFENRFHFSHLSTIEREMLFRSELALYYSYFKTVSEASTAVRGIHAVIYDNLTEYPNTINALKRFNVYPEVTLGLLYRAFKAFTDRYEIETISCWQVRNGKRNYLNCEGIGDLHYFYITPIFALCGFMMSLIFVFGWYLSDCNLFGGFISVTFFFFNHGESTRVMTSAGQREHFSFPFLILQLLFVTIMMRNQKPQYYRHVIPISISTFLFMLPWQFAQFPLLTQTACAFCLYVLDYIELNKIKILLHSQLLAIIFNYVFQFGNNMLLTSFHFPGLMAALLVLRFERKMQNFYTTQLTAALVKGFVWLTGTFTFKGVISGAFQSTDDSHIWEILKAKLVGFRGFHIMMYICSKAFDFLEWETIEKLTKSLLLPCVLVVTFVVLIQCISDQCLKANLNNVKSTIEYRNVEKEDVKRRSKTGLESCFLNKPPSETLYCILQTIAFTCMAILVMRLKLFMTPMMAIISSLLASRKHFGFIKSHILHAALLCSILSMAAVAGFQNLAQQWEKYGDFHDPAQEQMLNFINENLPKNAVFGGLMPTMANIKLSCLRPIVNHPHYEDSALRDRTMKVYAVYSRKSPGEVRDILQRMGVEYYVFEEERCYGKRKPGCSYDEMWDLVDRKNKHNSQTCVLISESPEPYFETIFQNNVYTILKVVKRTSAD